MGHARLANLHHGYSLWTGEAFEYMYVAHNDDIENAAHLPRDVLYEQLTSELRSKVIAEIESGEHDWVTLAAAYEVLRTNRQPTAPKGE